MDNVVGALSLKSWYGAVALGLMIFLQIVRKHPTTSRYWNRLPEGWRFLPGVVSSFAVAFVASYSASAPWNDAALAGVGGIFGIAIPAMGGAAWLKESHMPWDGGAGGKTRPQKPKSGSGGLGGMMFAALVVFMIPTAAMTALTSCASAPTAPLIPVAPKAPSAEKTERLAYNASAIAYEAADEALAAHIAKLRTGVVPPTPEQVDKATDLFDRLKRVHQELDVARVYLESKKSADGMQSIRLALLALRPLLAEAKADGIPIKQSVDDAIGAVLLLIGEKP